MKWHKIPNQNLWTMSIRVHDEPTWQRIKNGEITTLSVGGTFPRSALRYQNPWWRRLRLILVGLVVAVIVWLMLTLAGCGHSVPGDADATPPDATVADAAILDAALADGLPTTWCQYPVDIMVPDSQVGWTLSGPPWTISTFQPDSAYIVPMSLPSVLGGLVASFEGNWALDTVHVEVQETNGTPVVRVAPVAPGIMVELVDPPYEPRPRSDYQIVVSTTGLFSGSVSVGTVALQGSC